MRAVVELLLNLCLLRVGPERMPTAGIFVGLVLAADLLLSWLVIITAGVFTDPLLPVYQWVVHSAVLASGVYLILQFRGLSARFTRTFTAIIGGDLVVTAVQWPIVAAVDPDGPQTLALVLLLTLQVWWLTIVGFILSRALDASRAQGLAIAIFLWLVTLIVIDAALPTPPSAEARPPASPTGI